MVTKLRKSTVEICVVAGCILLVFISVIELVILHRKPNSNTFSSLNRGSAAEKASTVKVTEEERAKVKKNRMLIHQAKVKLRRKIRMEILALEREIAKLRKEQSMTPEQSSTKITNDLYARRVISIIKQSEKNDLIPFNSNVSEFKIPDSRLSDRVIRRNTNSSKGYNSHGNINPNHITYPAQVFGLPLTFQSNSTTQEIANGGFLNSNETVTPLKHFHDLDKSEENRFKNIIEEGGSFDDGNFSMMYEDNFNKVKKQFMEGTELFVEEEVLRRGNSLLQNLCEADPESLVGNTTDLQLNVTLDIEELLANNKDVEEGGEWKPSSCISRHRVAIIIPYRDRWNHLKVLLYYLIPTLKRQQVNFRIFVVEQFGNETFNKGRIMNAAFREALKLFDFQCVTFHDVDLVPEDDRNMYTCTEQPKHMSHSIDKFQYILPYQGLVGGVLMFKREHFQLVNGYSNMYWGWGAEDDDMTTRILYHGLRIYRPPSNIAKYKMVKHDGRKSSEVAVRMKLLRSAAKRSKLEGLNNVKYTLLFTHIEKLFTHFVVDIGTP